MKNIPVVTLVALVLTVVALVLLILFGDPARSATFEGILIGAVPSLLAAAYSERSSRDIRNGTVTDKARQGARAALDESGVTEVVQNAGQHQAAYVDTLNAHTAALVQLLTTKPPGQG